MPSQRLVIDVRTVPRQRPGWEISDDSMPQSTPHKEASFLLHDLLKAWEARVRDALVTYELALEWEESNPRIGLDPDVAIFRPKPPDPTGLRSIRTWVEGHEPPKVAIEIVSHTNSNKDYFEAPEKYAASGTGELWVFDPLMDGPKAHGGPFRIQVWVRQGDDFVRTYAGDGPAFSPFLSAWLVATDEGRMLRLADDKEATQFWPTREEAEREAKEAERAAKEAALARIAELEAALAKKT
jgi:Uma2 family endonuclease